MLTEADDAPSRGNETPPPRISVVHGSPASDAAAWAQVFAHAAAMGFDRICCVPQGQSDADGAPASISASVLDAFATTAEEARRQGLSPVRRDDPAPWLPVTASVEAFDPVEERRLAWHGKQQYVWLDPQHRPYTLWRLIPPGST